MTLLIYKEKKIKDTVKKKMKIILINKMLKNNNLDKNLLYNNKISNNNNKINKTLIYHKIKKIF